MSLAVADRNPYLLDFSLLEQGLAGSGLAWLRQARNSAIARFAELGFPTVQDESWRFTSLKPIASRTFRQARGYEGDALELPAARGFPSEALGSCELVFVNGRYAPGLSSRAPLPDGVTLGSLKEFLDSDPEGLQSHLAQHADTRGNALTALNTAFFDDGAYLRLPKGAVLKPPIHLLFVSGLQEGTVSHPRVLVVAEPGSQATLVENYAGRAGPAYFTNAVTEIAVGEDARVQHLKLQREGAQAFHIGALEVRQEAGSSFTSHSVSLGAALCRNEIRVRLSGEGADCALNGLYAVAGRQHVDNQTAIDHARPRCTSRELYKGVLDGSSRAVFNGTILVRPDAQKTNAMQANRNLLLSEGGLVNTRPELQILANDVKCKHGATIGQISPEALFYLRSRGIGEKAARGILVHAFANEVVDRIPIQAVREWLARLLSRPLSETQAP